MIKLLPITKCMQCTMLKTDWYSQICSKPKEKRVVNNINEIPAWCPLDDAEVQNET